jgi:hypothetical protein
LIETVVLTKDIDQHGLKKGDLGTGVEIYGEHDYEAEFVTVGGWTVALIAPKEENVRPEEPKDMVSVRKW